MTTETKTKAQVKSVPLEWRDQPTILVDQVVGFTSLENIGRITFGQMVFRPEQELPSGVPVITLAASKSAIVKIRDQLDDIIGMMNETNTELVSGTDGIRHD